MNPTYPVGTRVKLIQSLPPLPAGSPGTVTQTFFASDGQEYCYVHFDALPNPTDTMLAANNILAPA